LILYQLGGLQQLNAPPMFPVLTIDLIQFEFVVDFNHLLILLYK